MPHFCNQPNCSSDTYLCQRCGKVFCDNRDCRRYRDSKFITVNPLAMGIIKGNVCYVCQTPDERNPPPPKDITLDRADFNELLERVCDLNNALDQQFITYGWTHDTNGVYDALVKLRVPLAKALNQYTVASVNKTIVELVAGSTDAEYQQILANQKARREYLDSQDAFDEEGF